MSLLGTHLVVGAPSGELYEKRGEAVAEALRRAMGSRRIQYVVRIVACIEHYERLTTTEED